MPSLPSLPFIPILRRNEVYESLDAQALMDVRGETPLATVGMANPGLIRRDLCGMADSRALLRRIDCADLVAMTRRAGALFLEADLPGGAAGENQSPDDYVRGVSGTTGLPHAFIRAGMRRLGGVFERVDEVIGGLTRGLDLGVLDRGHGRQGGGAVGFYPVTECLGVVLPSNSVAVNALWIPAVALKIPVVLKPGREDPWTPWRVVRAFVEAGVPREAFRFYPAGHDGSGEIIRRCGRVMVFGGDKTVEQYAGDPRVEVHGPGRSKILIGEDAIDAWPDYLDVLEESVCSNSGRSCINASTIVAPRHADAIAEALAERMARIVPLPAEDDAARLAGFSNAAVAEGIDAAIGQGLESAGARDVSAGIREGGRIVVRDGVQFLLPTVLRVDSFAHPLANRESPFPCVSVVEAPQRKMLSAIGPSLVVTAVTSDDDWIAELLDSPHIDRLNVGPAPTNQISWDQPHEGNLFEFLYRRRSIQFSHA